MNWDKIMKNKIITVITVLILLIGIGFNIQCYAISNEQSTAIQSFLDEACRKSGTPGISVSILYEGETFFFSSGYANREEKLPANENTLYELASVSKAFTGVGILPYHFSKSTLPQYPSSTDTSISIFKNS